MKHFGIFAALITAGLAAHTYAQSTTPVLTVATKLVDNSPGDGKIKLGNSWPTAWDYKEINSEPCPVTSITPAYSYTLFGVACPVPGMPIPDPTPTPEPTPTPTPTPEPTQPAAVLSLTGTEAFARIGETVFGWNTYGGLGTLQDAPAAFQSAGQKFARKGFYTGGLDIIIPGVALDSMTVAYTLNGVRTVHGNQSLGMGVNAKTGVFTADGTWSAQIGPFLVHKKLTPAADGLSQVVTFSNTSGQPLSNVVIMFAQDPDNGDTGEQGVTSNKIVSRGLVTAKLASGKTHTLSTTHEAFKAGISPLIVSGGYLPNKPDAVVPQAVGYAVRADRNVYLRGVFPTVGAEAIVVPVEMGVR